VVVFETKTGALTKSLGNTVVGHEWANSSSNVFLACEVEVPDTIRLYWFTLIT